MTSTFLPAPGGIHLERMRWRMGLAKNEDWLTLEDDSLVRILRLPEPHAVRVMTMPSSAGVLDGVFVEFDTDDPTIQKRAATALAHCLSLDAPLEPFLDMAAKDALLAPLAREYRGLRVVCDADLFESGVKAIAGQQVNMAFAGTLVQRLREQFGEPVSLPTAWPAKQNPPTPPKSVAWDAPPIAFPAPERIAEADPNELRAMQFTMNKANAVVGFARAIASGSLDIGELATLDDDAVTEQLTALKGLGRWTAECMLLFGLGRPDLFPAADIGLRNALHRLVGGDVRPAEAEVREIGEAWRPHRSLATLYLWESLREAAH